MKVYKLEVCVVDHDELGPQQMKDIIENARYPNHCMNPKVVSAEERDIGPWRDDHPINNNSTFIQEFNKLFS